MKNGKCYFTETVKTKI